jgi:hypothetical protein
MILWIKTLIWSAKQNHDECDSQSIEMVQGWRFLSAY